MKKKELYAAPEVLILNLTSEGFICMSGELPEGTEPGGTGSGFGDGGEG